MAPDGWKLVPVEPTQSMNNAGLSAVNQHGKRFVWETYRAMLAAAPATPQADPKREPLSDDDINKLAWKQNLWTDHMIEFSFLAFAREVERAHGIGGSDAE